jgi:hypothetical protein
MLSSKISSLLFRRKLSEIVGKNNFVYACNNVNKVTRFRDIGLQPGTCAVVRTLEACKIDTNVNSQNVISERWIETIIVQDTFTEVASKREIISQRYRLKSAAVTEFERLIDSLWSWMVQ